MKWIELLLATALFATLAYFSRYLFADFRSGIARGRYTIYKRADQPAWFWPLTIVRGFLFSLIVAASLAALIGAAAALFK